MPRCNSVLKFTISLPSTRSENFPYLISTKHIVFFFKENRPLDAVRRSLADIVGIHRNFAALLELHPVFVIFYAIIVNNGMAISDNKERFLRSPKYPTEQMKSILSRYITENSAVRGNAIINSPVPSLCRE